MVIRNNMTNILELFLSYMCELLAAHPYFNFAFNILHAIVPVLNAVQESARLKVKEAIQTVFKVGSYVLIIIYVIIIFVR